MANIFKLAPLHLSRLHGQRWRGALQRLNASHLVDGKGVRTPLEAEAGASR